MLATAATPARRTQAYRATLAIAAAALLLAAKCIAAFTLRVNSDEPQHLHVVWAWTQGLLPYTDLFDNHAPLFHVLYAPVLSWLGERADIVPWMRCAVIPWYFACLWLCYRLGRALFGREVGWLGAVLLALQPTFFARSTEFRPDDAWAAAWLAAVVVACEGSTRVRRAYHCGLLAGLAAALSIKSAILIAAALCAAAMLLLISWWQERGTQWITTLRIAASVAAGGAVLPLTIAAAFVLAGAAHAIFFCLVQYNTAPGLGRWQHVGPDIWIFPTLLPLLAIGAHVAWRRVADRVRFARQAWVLCTGVLYLALRASYQPLLDRQDVLPLIPMLTPFVAAALVLAWRRWRALAAASTAFALLLEVSLTLHAVRPWSGEAAQYAAELDTLLNLAQQREFVMDDKAESIFRPRPVYWLLENVTLYRLKTGSIPDDIVRGLIANRVAVGVFERETGADRTFIDQHYVPIAPHVEVLGQRFGSTAGPIEFDIAIPRRYAIVARQGAAQGTLDGVPYQGPRTLEPGMHRFVPDHGDDWALEWARAAQLGYSPFAHDKPATAEQLGSAAEWRALALHD
jgi:hypothetical protein